MKTLLTLLLFGTFVSTQAQEYGVLVGTWQVQGKPQFEQWQQVSENELTGASYKIIGEEKKVTETLSIIDSKDRIVYEATVPNQNEGIGIPFILNRAEKDVLSFENLSHDFPKKIRYTIKNSKLIFVEVLGENDEGFSYFLEKVE